MAKKTTSPEENGLLPEVPASALDGDAVQMPEISTQDRRVPDKPCEAGFFCYIGPSLSGLIQHGTIYRGSRADALQAAAPAIERQPLVKTLIVSGDSLPLDRLKAKTPGTALYNNCRRIAGM